MALVVPSSDRAEMRGQSPHRPSHTFLSTQPPFSCLKETGTPLWVLTQEPGDSAVIRFQPQEVTEQTQLYKIPIVLPGLPVIL
jgi:hypothetical protein